MVGNIQTKSTFPQTLRFKIEIDFSALKTLIDTSINYVE